ncbi:L-serine ammonia-lyase, iron-sulfur-dependent, subunit beta [Candidatus Peregrinibacteria bacterium]|nr:L-serine ammonia-lyase, iron-sulfur-dependent, subunit beta [Candidatus Peregrinibacteria bacterium]
MSTNLSIFDIAGPIMVGPSSSHTAGACKIGQFARALFHHTPKKVTFYLHGSFGEVYKGHATDLALLAGVMKFKTSDPKIKNAFEIAKEKHLNYKFLTRDLGEKYHPNTVKIVLEKGKEKMSVIGSSVGGGMIEIVKIDDFEVYLKGTAGKYLSLVVCHDENPKVLKDLERKINKLGIKIAETVQSHYKDERLSVLSLEGRRITLEEVMELEKNSIGIDFIRSLSKLQQTA